MAWEIQASSRWDARNELLARYERDLATGAIVPFLYPWSTAAAGLVLAYLLIPQSSSPFIKRIRYAVWVINAIFSLYGIACTRMRLSLGYGGGLISAWAILWTSVLLLNHDVQTDFKRIESTRHRTAVSASSANGDTAVKLNSEAEARRTAPGPQRYQWEGYPQTSLRKRFIWVAALFTEFRGIGWNWQLPNSAPLPRKIREQLGADISYDTSVGRDGTKRYDIRNHLLRAASIKFALSYLFLDFLIILATHDPYFWGYVDAPAPAFLPAVFRESAFLLRAYRNVYTMLAVVAALQFFFALGPLVFVGIMSSKRIGVWGEPWMYPDVWGSFGKVLDYGLIGFWGSWWHQAFRYAFESNASALVRLFMLDEGTNIGRFMKILIAFTLSGFLHASASYASLGETFPLSGSFLFFFLQPFGITAQMVLKQILRKSGNTAAIPKLVQQVVTLSMTYVWLHYTAPLLCDEFARSGLWMIEPLPVSLLRGLGLGDKRDGWWCWRGSWSAWHSGQHWWQTGIAL